MLTRSVGVVRRISTAVDGFFERSPLRYWLFMTAVLGCFAHFRFGDSVLTAVELGGVASGSLVAFGTSVRSHKPHSKQEEID